MEHKLQAARWRIAAFGLVLLGGGGFAVGSVVQTARADRRVREAKSGLSTTAKQLEGLEGCSDADLSRLSRQRPSVDLENLMRAFGRLRPSWLVVDGPASEGQRLWVLKAAGVASQKWPEMLHDLASIDAVDGARVVTLTAVAANEPKIPATLIIEARVVATVSIGKEPR